MTDRVTAFCLAHLADRPVVIGINGPQGCGKSTLAAGLVRELARRGLPAVTVSIDDFYLPRSAQVELGRLGNPYLEHRGYPGTHDVPLGVQVIDALRHPSPGEVRVPVYDKSRHGGRGDRAPEPQWRTVERPFRAVFVEGWMLGFRPVADVPEPALTAPNAALAAYAAWDERLDAFIHLEAEREEHIVEWRIDAERSRREAGADALSDEDARDYILRFLPAYRLYVPALRASPPAPCLHILLARDRSPVR